MFILYSINKNYKTQQLFITFYKFILSVLTLRNYISVFLHVFIHAMYVLLPKSNYILCFYFFYTTIYSGCLFISTIFSFYLMCLYVYSSSKCLFLFDFPTIYPMNSPTHNPISIYKMPDIFDITYLLIFPLIYSPNFNAKCVTLSSIFA